MLLRDEAIVGPGGEVVGGRKRGVWEFMNRDSEALRGQGDYW